MKILFVDDMKDVKNYISNVLKNWGYEVELASNGLEALEIIRQQDVQLVISDWMMPKMDGLQLCSKLRSSDFGHYVYLILLTAKSDNNDLVEGLSAGADDFISKPINTEILKARIDSAIRIIEMENKLARANNLLQDQNEGIKSNYAQLDANMQEIQQIIGDTEVVVLKSKNSGQQRSLIN
ncbi:MAG: response regulator [Methylococcales bacterium]